MSKAFLAVAASAAFVCVGALAWQQAAPSLPAPYATPSVSNGAKVISRPAGADLKVPAGFAVAPYAAGFQRPRFMVEGPKGEVLISDSVANGAVYLLLDKDNDFQVDSKKALLEGLDRPSNMAFWKDYLYVAEATTLKRYKYDAVSQTLGTGEEIVPMKDFGKGHNSRSVAIQGGKLYVGIGSSANVATGDPALRAAISRYNLDGSGQEIIATGIRNPVSLRFYPKSNVPWTTVQERDGLGDGLVPDFFTSIRSGGFYGWPYAYIGPNPEPRIEAKEQRKDLVDSTIKPDVILEPHIAVMDFLFYTGKQFPAEYRGGAFLANHGSSNRVKRVGYSVSFVPFKNGKPAGPTRDFLTGYMLSPDEKEVWGRPVGLLQLRDGSLLLSEDGGKTVWRIAYKG